VLLLLSSELLLSLSPGLPELGMGLNGAVGSSVMLGSLTESGFELGLGLGAFDDGVDTNDVLPARDSREVAAAGVGRDSVLDFSLKYSEAAPASVVVTLKTVWVVERVEVTTDA
jgi:hypothetical protein